MTHSDAPEAAAPPPRMNRTMLGIGLMLAGFFCFAISDTAAKKLTEEMHPLQVVWFRQLGLLSVALWILSRRGFRVLATRHPFLQSARGFVAAMSATCFILAVREVPLADAVAVSFVAPFMVTALGALILREPVGIRRWSAIAVGFAGMLIVVRPGAGIFHPAIGLVVVAAGFFAARQILSRLIGSDDPTATTIAYTSLVSTVLLTVPLMIVWRMPESDWVLVSLVIVACAAALGEVLVIRALELAHAVVLAPMQYSMILWSTALGFIVFNTLPDRYTLIGAAVIMCSGIYTLHRERLASRNLRQTS